MDKTPNDLRYDLEKFSASLKKAKKKASNLVKTAKNLYKPNYQYKPEYSLH